MEPHPQSIEFAAEREESAWSTLAFAWRRKGLVVIALIVGLGLGYLYFLRQDPLYQSHTQVLVVEEQQQLPIEGLEWTARTQDMHATMMRSQEVVEKAVELGDLDQISSLRGSSNPAAVVLGRLKVSGGGTAKGSILRLSYQSPNRQECPQVLEAIVLAYDHFLDKMYMDVSKETLELIGEAKDQLEKQIAEKEAVLRTMLDDSPLLVTGETAQNVHEMRLQQIESVRSEALLENSKLRAKIESLLEAVKQGVSPDVLNMIAGSVLQESVDQGIAIEEDPESEKAAQLFPLLVEEQMLLQNHGEDHPKVIALRKRIALTRDYLARAAAMKPKTPDVSGDSEDPEREFYEIYIESLQAQIKMNDQTIREMTELFDQERDSAKSLSTYKVQEETLRSEIERKTRLFDVVLKRLEEINLVQGRDGAEIQTIHPPSTASQIQPNLQSTMLTAGVLSLLAGLVLAFVADAADRRFKSPDEIRNDLGVPVIGHIPLIPGTEKRKGKRKKVQPEGDGFPAELRTVHAPRGRIAEAYRAVRTAIYFSTRGGGHQIIQITSPTPGDGKTTLAANLAVSIANSGKRVLLIDADFRRPRCHKLLRLDNSLGMTAVIEDACEWQDAVQESGVENLSVLPCGKRPKHPSELLTSPRFAELLEIFREQFEIVIVDTPPVMAVTDPLNVAPRVDGLLLVLQLTKNARTAARRTLDSLEEIGSNVLGVVVNGVGKGEHYGSYGYNRYGYSYGYGYRYGKGYGTNYDYRYGNSYGYDDDVNYYVESEEDAEAEAHRGNGHTDP